MRAMSKRGGYADGDAAAPLTLAEPRDSAAEAAPSATYEEPTDTQQYTRELVTVAEEEAVAGRGLPLPAPPSSVEFDSLDSLESITDYMVPESRQIATTGPTADATTPEVLTGVRIGRYVIIEELGSGSMGQVYAAYDPKLDRKVAIKLLSSSKGKQPRSRKARARLAREARALAKLSHPNVVTVYDADEHGDDVFIAMELVEGQSLGAWCNATPRPPWRSVLERYLQAARGLSAAHDVGLIHRDFKPDNVLVGDDGRVRVADFGIAALSEPSTDSVERSSDLHLDLTPAESLSSIERLVDDNLTRTGAALGTPAYMAPEQHIGGHIGPATDQYALCAALYEGLYGVRPFACTSRKQVLAVLLRKKRELDLEAPVTGADVPDWVRQALLRGLAPRAAERWPSVAKLAAALDKSLRGRRPLSARTDSRARRRGFIVGAVAGVVVLGAIGLLALGWLRGSAEDRGTCARAHREIDRVWNDKAAARVRAAFATTGRANAAASADRVESILGAYATEWTAMRVDICEATHVREQQSEQVQALRMHCLDRRKNRLDALVSALVDPQALSAQKLRKKPADNSPDDSPDPESQKSDPDILGHAVEAALTLPTVAECADVDRLSATVALPDDPALRTRVSGLLDRVDRAAVLHQAGLYGEARDIARSVLDELTDIEYPPLKARALFELAFAQMRLDISDDAEKTFRELLPIAAAAKDDALIARTWGKIIEVVGIHQGRHDDALEWVPVATAMIERADDELVGTEVWTSISHVMRAAGKYQEALDRDRASLEVRERLRPAVHFDVAETLHNIGESLWYLGKYEEAREVSERALAIWIDTVGEDHPRTTATLSNLGTISNSLGDHATGLKFHERTLGIAERTFGPDHPSITTNLNNLGVAYFNIGRPREALKYMYRSLAIRERTYPENHPHIAMVCANIASTLEAAGDYKKSLSFFERALAIHEKSLDANHPTAAWGHRNLGGLLSRLGRYEEARAHLDQAMKMFESKFGKEHEYVATTLHLLGDLLGERGKYQQALASHRRALAIQRKVHGEEHKLIADALNHLGQTLWRMGEYEQARTNFQQALAMHEKMSGAKHYAVGYVASNLGILLADMGDYDEAERYYLKAQAISKEGDLRNQSSVAHAIHYRGVLQHEIGKYRTAEKTLERAASMRAKHLGSEHPDTATSWFQLAQVLRDRGNARARKLHERARTMREATFGSEHAAVADSLDAIGDLAGDDRRWKEAEKAHEQALAIRRKQQGERHPDFAISLVGLARATLARGHIATARGHYQKARTIRERVFGKRHPRVADSLIGLAQVELADGEERKAKRLAEEALDICQGFGHRCSARAEFTLATVRASSRRTRRKAKKLAERIADAAGKAGNRRLEDKIQRWLDR